ncbi:Intradiol ring-cleavage dioxygenase [Mycena floridula]|nr:Intradiol ring-cleavage dioxygenase [Mycena floridula]
MSSIIPLSSKLQVECPAIPFSVRSRSTLYMIYKSLVTENFFLWSSRQGKWNDMADMEGPYYIYGAPDRMLEPGKALMAGSEDFKNFIPFLFTGQVLSASGDPLPNVLLDWWQANSTGVYYHDKYRLRGTFRTDSEGKFECFSVTPGKYGPENMQRAGHLHITLTTPANDTLTTQLYLCRSNDSSEMESDFLNYFRAPRPNNMIEGFCIPDQGIRNTHFLELPSFEDAFTKGSESERIELEKLRSKIDWWNGRVGVQAKVVAHKVIRMSK